MTELNYLESTRTAYDTVAVSYAEALSTLMDELPWDRAVLRTFAELVRTAGGGLVADVGCGPGRVTTYLHDLGLDVFGIDLSPAMVAVARESYPHLRFDEGTMTGLDLADGALTGLVAWYSTIHTPTELLPTVFAEFARVLAPGGELVVAFQVGDARDRLEQGYGHPISLDAYRRSPDLITELLADAGAPVHARLVREKEGRERHPQAYLLARKPALP
jgi:SAM-dependent methyltransferase